MAMKSAGLSLIAILVGLCAASPGYSAARSSADVPYSTPPGITLIDVVDAGDKFLWRRLGDASGKPLYTYDLEGDSGRSSCYDQCAKEFPPLIAPNNAVTVGEWSLVRRGNGVKQWAYQGRPLYQYSGPEPTGTEPADRRNARTGGPAQALSDPASRVNSPKAGWRRAAYAPSVPTPAGITFQGLPVANGYGFLVSGSQMAIYVLKTQPTDPTAWTPVYAPEVAKPIGDFSIATRKDGTAQWAYHRQLLYTFNGDYSSSDLNGLLAQKDARPALAYRNFLPSSIAIKIVPLRGPMMVNAKGLAVYTEIPYKLQYGGRHSRDGYRYPYEVAKKVGTAGCVAECTATWHPLRAAADAQSSGFWEVETRADGSKQWAYKGSALYTYAGDKALGDIEGNNLHVVLFGDLDGHIIDLPFTGGGADRASSDGSGFYWHIVTFFE